MKISEILKDKYKLRIPPTVFYELLADVQEAEEAQEPVIDKIRAEIEKLPYALITLRYISRDKVIEILDKYKAESEGGA